MPTHGPDARVAVACLLLFAAAHLGAAERDLRVEPAECTLVGGWGPYVSPGLVAGLGDLDGVVLSVLDAAGCGSRAALRLLVAP